MPVWLWLGCTHVSAPGRGCRGGDASASPHVPVLAPSRPSGKTPNHHFAHLFLFAGCLSDKKLGNTSGREDFCSAGRGIDAIGHQHLFLPRDRAKQGKSNQIKAKLQSLLRVLSKIRFFFFFCWKQPQKAGGEGCFALLRPYPSVLCQGKRRRLLQPVKRFCRRFGQSCGCVVVALTRSRH